MRQPSFSGHGHTSATSDLLEKSLEQARPPPVAVPPSHLGPPSSHLGVTRRKGGGFGHASVPRAFFSPVFRSTYSGAQRHAPENKRVAKFGRQEHDIPEELA